jgi:outer membrane protein
VKKIFALAAVAVLASYVGSAKAQDIPAPVPTGVDNMVGAVVVAVPDYEGSDDYTGAVGPVLKFKFGGERYIQVLGNKGYLNILSKSKTWEFGPMAVYRGGRDGSDIDDAVVKLMADVDDSVELGAFVSYRKVYNNNMRHRFVGTLGVTQDVSDGHDGMVAALSGVYWTPVSKMFDIGIRGGIQYASDDYMDSFFSVNAGNVGTSGLSTFNADAGFKDVSLALMFAAHFNKSWHVGGGLFYKKLLGDASDSPVVDVRGDDSQLIAGLAVMYTW